MFGMDEEMAEAIKANIMPGMKIRLLKMDDKQAPPPGTIGTVTYVDSAGTIHMEWENGSSLGICIDKDKFEIL